MPSRSKQQRPRRPEAELLVRALGARGDGLAEHGGRKVFIPHVAPGDRVRVRLGERRGEGVVGEPLELIAAGPARVAPPCPHFGACGGCSAQHLSDDAYLAWKQDILRQALRQRDLGHVPVDPPIRVPADSRRRVTFAARRGRDGLFLGFHERQSSRIIDLRTCLVARPEIVSLLPALRPLLEALLADGEAADVAVALLDDGLDVVVAAARPPRLAERERLAAFAEQQDLARLSWVVGDAPAEPVAHRRPGVLRLGGIPVVVPPGGFLQASREGEAALTELVAAAVGTAARVADLFAGLGTFALPLSRTARVAAYDADAAATGALDRAARLKPRLSITAHVRDLFRNPVTAAELAEVDAAVFDPPRVGGRAQAAELAASSVPLVVGVSCNPASFARDARTLVDGGYRLERVMPVDQFTWSSHLELVGIFRR